MTKKPIKSLTHSSLALTTGIRPNELLLSVWDDVGRKFNRFCLTTGK